MAEPRGQGPPKPSPLPNRATPLPQVLQLVGGPGYGRGKDSSPTARAFAADHATAPDAAAAAADPAQMMQATALHAAAPEWPPSMRRATLHLAAPSADTAPDAATAPDTGFRGRSSDPTDEMNTREWYDNYAKINTKGCPEVWVPVGTKVWKYSNELRTYVEEIATKRS